MIPLPSPAELPLVMGVVGLRRVSGQAAARSEEWMWGIWRSAHDPDTSEPEDDPGEHAGSRPQTVTRDRPGMTPGSDDGERRTSGTPEGRRYGPEPRSSAPSGRSCRSSSASRWFSRC